MKLTPKKSNMHMQQSCANFLAWRQTDDGQVRRRRNTWNLKIWLLFSLSASVSMIWQTRGKSQVQATRLHCCRRYVRWNLDLSVHAKKEKPQRGREIPTEKSWVSDSRVNLLSDLLLLVAKHFNRTQNLNSTEINTQNIFFSTQNSSFSTTSAKAAVP